MNLATIRKRIEDIEKRGAASIRLREPRDDHELAARLAAISYKCSREDASQEQRVILWRLGKIAEKLSRRAELVA